MSKDEGGRSPAAGFVITFILGLLIGGGVASGVFINRERQRDAAIETKLADLGRKFGGDLSKQFAIDGLLPGGNGRAADGAPAPTDEGEAKALAVGKDFVIDLENNRLASAFRMLSAEFQKTLKRDGFDAMIAQYPGFRTLNAYTREFKARKSFDGKGYDFYFTGRDNSKIAGSELLNIAMTLNSEQGVLRITELEIRDEGTKK